MRFKKTALLLLGIVLSVIVTGSAQAAGAPQYKICNSGNSVTVVEGYNTSTGESKAVLPGSAYCRYMGSSHIEAIWIDPRTPGGTGMERYRIRPGDSNTYGPWHCGEADFNVPDAWVNQGGIDIETSGSKGTTC